MQARHAQGIEGLFMQEKEQNGKVSIVLPVYNGERCVANSIESVLKQTYNNWELIAVNDCSTDDTQSILETYARQDDRIKIISNPVNLKLPRTLNAGFAQATGEYYTWTSDDNLYKENAIEEMVRALKSQPEFDMVYANYTNIDGEDRILGDVLLGEPKQLPMGNVVGACFLYTREIAQKVGEYDANLFLAEDYDYWIRILRMGKILHIEKILYFYRRHGGSLSSTQKDRINGQTYRMLEKNFLFLYSYARSVNQQYKFFEHLLCRVEKEHLKEAQKMLYTIDKVYFLYRNLIRRNKK